MCVACEEEKEVRVLIHDREMQDEPVNDPVAGRCGRMCNRTNCPGQCQISGRLGGCAKWTPGILMQAGATRMLGEDLTWGFVTLSWIRVDQGPDC